MQKHGDGWPVPHGMTNAKYVPGHLKERLVKPTDPNSPTQNTSWLRHGDNELRQQMNCWQPTRPRSDAGGHGDEKRKGLGYPRSLLSQ